MQHDRLPFDSTLDRYEDQTRRLLAGYRAADPDAVRAMKQLHPRFRDAEIPWLVRNVSDEDVQAAAFDLPDAQIAIARWYNFRDWLALVEYVDAVTQDGPVRRFESAVEAVIHGDMPALQRLLRDDPGLARARSTRACCFDPPRHRATLLHYIAANGVEGYREKTPPNAVEIAKALLESGADPDALADMYGGQCTTMSMLVSSSYPAEAGVQVPLIDTLVDFGASVEPSGTGHWTSPLMTALIFGFRDGARALVRRGASVPDIAAAAGLGRLDDVRQMLPRSDAEARHRALALAAQLDHADIVQLLLDAGEDPNRYNPEGFHAHATPLHNAIWNDRDDIVRLLVERGARLDMKDKIYQSTPLGWAIYGKKVETEKYLREHGAQT